MLYRGSFAINRFIQPHGSRPSRWGALSEVDYILLLPTRKKHPIPFKFIISRVSCAMQRRLSSIQNRPSRVFSKLPIIFVPNDHRFLACCFQQSYDNFPMSSYSYLKVFTSSIWSYQKKGALRPLNLFWRPYGTQSVQRLAIIHSLLNMHVWYAPGFQGMLPCKIDYLRNDV